MNVGTLSALRERHFGQSSLPQCSAGVSAVGVDPTAGITAPLTAERSQQQQRQQQQEQQPQEQRETASAVDDDANDDNEQPQQQRQQRCQQYVGCQSMSLSSGVSAQGSKSASLDPKTSTNPMDARGPPRVPRTPVAAAQTDVGASSKQPTVVGNPEAAAAHPPETPQSSCAAPQSRSPACDGSYAELGAKAAEGNALANTRVWPTA